MSKSRSPRSKFHLGLAQRVEQWALINGLRSEFEVSTLIEDLRQQRFLNFWASQDTETLLPKPKLAAVERLRVLQQRLLFLRNVIVFLPVTITWIAISEASSSFSSFIAENEAIVVNFLEFWQGGYGDLNPFWKLSSIALIDFFILAVIILLTIGAQLLKLKSESLVKKQDPFPLEERFILLQEIKEFLSQQESLTPVTVNRQLATSLRNLSRSTENLERLTRDFGKTIKGFPGYIATMREIELLKQGITEMRRKDDRSQSR